MNLVLIPLVITVLVVTWVEVIEWRLERRDRKRREASDAETDRASRDN